MFEQFRGVSLIKFMDTFKTAVECKIILFNINGPMVLFVANVIILAVGKAQNHSLKFVKVAAM